MTDYRQKLLRGESLGVIFKQAPSEAVTTSERDGRRLATFVISTGDEDRDGDVIDQKGWDLTAYERNPVVLFSHDAKRPPVAKTVEMRVYGDKLKATVEFPPRGVYDFADTVYGLVKGGFLRGASVGFRPVKASPRPTKGVSFERQEMYEFSILPVPSNRNALVEAKAAGLGREVDAIVKAAIYYAERPETKGRSFMGRIQEAVAEVAAFAAGLGMSQREVVEAGERLARRIPGEIALEQARRERETRATLPNGQVVSLAELRARVENVAGEVARAGRDIQQGRSVGGGTFQGWGTGPGPLPSDIRGR